MTAGELALVVGAVLCALAFAALAVMLVRVLDTLADLRRRRRGDAPGDRRCSRDFGTTTREAAMSTARADLERFDRVLGSAEAISDAVGRSQPSRADGVLDADDQGRRDRHRHVAGRQADAEGGVMRRAAWFVGGVAAGAAGAGYAKRRSARAANKLAPTNVANSATSALEPGLHRVIDAVQGGRVTAARRREHELQGRARRHLVRLGDHLADGDQLLVDGEAGRVGRVIVMRQRDRKR